MAFKHHNRNLAAIISLVVMGSVGLGWALFSARVHLSIVLGAIVIAGVGLLFSFLTSTNREVLFFFNALENDDTSISYRSDRRSRFIDELHQYLNTLNLSFREMKMSSELRENYFSRILENLSSGLVVISKTGHINHINDEALRLLGIEQLTHIRALAALQPTLYARVKEMKPFQKAEFVLPVLLVYMLM